ncbi:hypothetical protein CDLVIII_1654 [Clostridium sp. DL-VIII]|uniref:hypothetical protein n=1 Tax=Clostridium sp. DL-VIII TaxID=641107 RepID=UPI00023AFD17|nr:hypothetical protein [Clostridium sp. DL-VIII]EHI98345.1 hypothetical protein CDLVIII_1654 [Clostridium sp. DL-VIII]
MKIRKLLSIGAIGLALVSATSIGASAATTSDGLSPKTKTLIKVMAKQQYQNGKNQTDLFSGVNKDSKIGSVANSTVIAAVGIASPEAQTKLENNIDLTFEAALDKVTTNEDTFYRFKSYFITAAGKLEEAENKTGDKRVAAETEFRTFVNLYNSKLKVNFGKDGYGETSATLMEGSKLLGEVNETEVQKAINEVNDLDYDKALAAEKDLNSAN